VREWLSMGLCGCTAAEGLPEPSLEASLEIGTGTQAFLPVQGELELVAGPQGGWHVDVALRATGIEPEGAELVWQGEDAETGERVTFVTTARLSRDSVLPTEDGWERVGDRVVFEIGSPQEVLGAELTLSASLSAGALALEQQLTAPVVDLAP
jgi:hypothetical protein